MDVIIKDTLLFAEENVLVSRWASSHHKLLTNRGFTSLQTLKLNMYGSVNLSWTFNNEMNNQVHFQSVTY